MSFEPVFKTKCTPLPPSNTAGIQQQFFESELSFEDNLELCKSLPEGHIISIHSAAFFDILVDSLFSLGLTSPVIYIGLHDEFGLAESSENVTRFSWEDNTTFNFGLVGGEFPWQLDSPSANSTNNCVGISLIDNTTGFWVDVDCGELLPVVCSNTCTVEEESFNFLLLYGAIPVVIVLFLMIFGITRVLSRRRVINEKFAFMSLEMDTVDDRDIVKSSSSYQKTLAFRGRKLRPSGVFMSTALAEPPRASRETEGRDSLAENATVAIRMEEEYLRSTSTELRESEAPSTFFTNSVEIRDSPQKLTREKLTSNMDEDFLKAERQQHEITDEDY